jgi:hypothetical protein
MAIYGASPKEQLVEGDVQKAGERAGAFKGRVAAILPARDGRDGYIQFGRESVLSGTCPEKSLLEYVCRALGRRS